MGNAFQRKTVSVTITNDSTRVVNIPIDNFNPEYHKFELRMGGVPFSDYRYTIKGNAIHLNDDQNDFIVGRQLDFVCYWNALILSKDNMPQFIRSEDIIDQSVETKKLVPYAQEVIDGLADIQTYPCDVEVVGRTLKNLLGRAGNAIYGMTHKLHTVNDPSLGSLIEIEGDAYKLDTPMTSEAGRFVESKVTKPGYYILIGEVKQTISGHASSIIYATGDVDNYIAKADTYDLDTWATVYNKVHVKDGSFIPAFGTFSDTADGSACYAKYFRLYEISKEEYDKIAVDVEYTGARLAEKYPYVDDIKSVVNPYIECNENLLIENDTWVRGTINPGGSVNVVEDSPLITHVSMKSVSKKGAKYTILMEGMDIDPASYKLVLWNMRENSNETLEKHISTNNIATITAVEPGVLKYGISIENNNATKVAEVLTNIQTGKWKPVLVKGSVPKTYEECHNSTMMFETTLYGGEKITRDNSGKYVKNSEWGELEFSNEGVIPAFVVKYTGFKGFTIPRETIGNVLLTVEKEDEPHQIIAYDGTYYEHRASFSTSNGAPTMNFDPTFGTDSKSWREMSFTLPNSLTGWGDAYTPTPEEVRAFFLGWKMYSNGGNFDPYNGTGDKFWVKLWCGIGQTFTHANGIRVCTGDGSWTNDCPTTLNNQGYIPYRFIYKKENSILEEVKTHGTLTVKSGTDINVSSGLVLGESNVIQGLSNGQFYINGTSTVLSRLKHRMDVGRRVSIDDIDIRFIQNNASASENIIPTGKGNLECFVSKESLCSVDYTIYKPDTVVSFETKVHVIQSAKEIIERTIREISTTNTKLSKENRSLRAKIEQLPTIINPNLLLNGDFRLNQRGHKDGKLAANVYCRDRWTVRGGSAAPGATFTTTETGAIRLSRTVADDLNKNIEIWQLIDDDIWKGLRGRTCTLSAKLKTNCKVTLRVGAELISSREYQKNIGRHNEGVFSFTFTLKDADLPYAWGFGVQMIKDATNTINDFVEIEWIKLEYGDKATPFVPRDLGEELTLCQRYYERRAQHVYALNRINSTQTGTSTFYKVTKRTNATVKMTLDDKPDTILVTKNTGDRSEAKLGSYVVQSSTNGFNIVVGHAEMTAATFSYEVDADIY